MNKTRQREPDGRRDHAASRCRRKDGCAPWNGFSSVFTEAEKSFPALGETPHSRENSFPAPREVPHSRENSFPKVGEGTQGAKKSFPRSKAAPWGREESYPTPRQAAHSKENSFPEAWETPQGLEKSFPESREPPVGAENYFLQNRHPPLDAAEISPRRVASRPRHLKVPARQGEVDGRSCRMAADGEPCIRQRRRAGKTHDPIAALMPPKKVAVTIEVLSSQCSVPRELALDSGPAVPPRRASLHHQLPSVMPPAWHSTHQPCSHHLPQPPCCFPAASSASGTFLPVCLNSQCQSTFVSTFSSRSPIIER